MDNQKQKKNNLEDLSVKETLKTGEETEENLAEAEEAPKEQEPQEEAPLSREEELEASLAESNDKLMRILAEYDNFRKRSQKEKDSIYDRASAETVAKFIPVVDNMERAMAQECKDEEYAKGIKLIMDALMSTLDSLGVKEFGEVGEEFDAERHNAVMHIEDENLGENVVANVLQKGYTLGDRVIRFAVVTVAN